MRIDKIKISPVNGALNAEFEIELEIFIQREYELPLEMAGEIYSDDDKKIANITGFSFLEQEKTLKLEARNDRNAGEEKITIKAFASLNEKALDYIETRRTAQKKNDVKLKLDIRFKTLHSKTTISHMFLANNSSTAPLPKPYEAAIPVYYKYQQNQFHTSNQHMWILSGDGGTAFIEFKNNSFKKDVTIPSSDWIHDFCPQFGIGNFTVFEFIRPEYTEGSGCIEERLSGSMDAIKKMKEHIIAGEWNEAIEDSRAVWELLKNQTEITELLSRDGYTEIACIDLNESLKKLFDFTSKFHHREDKGKNIMPVIKASKEDAYLIYSLSINAVNLISKKIQRLDDK